MDDQHPNRRAPDDEQVEALGRAEEAGTLPEIGRRAGDVTPEPEPEPVPEPVQEVAPAEAADDEIERPYIPSPPMVPEAPPRRWWQW